MNRIVVVGGGISGLALAYRLEQLLPQADVTVRDPERIAGPGRESRGRDLLVRVDRG